MAEHHRNSTCSHLRWVGNSQDVALLSGKNALAVTCHMSTL